MTTPRASFPMPLVRTSAQFWNIIDDVWHERVKRAEVEMSDEVEDGKHVIAVIYRVNEHVPVRVDFKPKKEER